MTVRELTTDDLGWAVETLARRRAALVPHAPVLWRPAPGADRVHRAHLAHLITDGGGRAFRTDTALLVAAPRQEGWIIDDGFVTDGAWNTTGRELWDAFAASAGGRTVRFVCPVHESERRDFAARLGLTPVESWWHLDIPTMTAPVDSRDPQVEGATALLVPAPPIYDPGGPILFVREVTDPARALPAAGDLADQLGCPLVVVNQAGGDTALALALATAGFRHHCDFLDGTV